MEIRDDEIVFSTGKTAHCYAGVIGINENLSLSYGLFGRASGGTAFTKEEREELADHMVALWTRYKNG